jgi:glucokinase
MPAKKQVLSTSKKKPAARVAGRPPLAIGIDMGGTSVKMGVVQGAEILFHADPIPTKDFKGSKPLLAAMAETVRQLLQTAPGIRALGIGVPGFADVNTGMVYNLTNVPGWRNVELNSVLSRLTGLPCFAENDANCMAYAEYCHGAGRGAVNMVAVTLGTGVGGGLVINGQLFRGSASGAGEIGQMSIDHAGKPGSYGNTGALEEYVGNKEVAVRAAAIYAAAGRSLEDYSPSSMAREARRNDPQALQVWDEFTTHLACALSNCVWLINPDKIVIGGGIAKAGPVLFSPLRQKMKNQLAGPFKKNLDIVSARFGNDAGIIGSAAVAVERLK